MSDRYLRNGGMSSFLEQLESRGIGVEGLKNKDVESKILASLAGELPVDIAAIVGSTGSTALGVLLQTLEKLTEFGLVKKVGVEGDERFILSDAGRRAASAMGALSGQSKMNLWGECFIVGAFGASVGASELVARYKDEPISALLTIPGSLYLLLNLLA